MSDNGKPKLQVKFSPPKAMPLLSEKPVNKVIIQSTPQYSAGFLVLVVFSTIVITLGCIAGLIWILLRIA